MVDPRFTPGTVVRGKYRVERVVGSGGMGMVLGAWHLRLDQRVAIKVLLPEMSARPDIVKRFEREARAASRIDNEHVARVMDVDTLDDGSSFLVMEFLEGRDLSFVRRSGVPLEPAQAVACVLQACRALADAHAAGVIHRDLKPANLFVARRRDGGARIKVLDFGISKVTSADVDAAGHGTKTAAMIGSADYMSPEQMTSSRDVDARTDIWSLGVVLFELCTAVAPVAGEALPHVCAAVMTKEPPAPRSLRPELPAGLEAVILRCLRKAPDERYASVAELASALAPYAPEDVDGVQPVPSGAWLDARRRVDEEAPTEVSGGEASSTGARDRASRPSEAHDGVVVGGGVAGGNSASATVAVVSLVAPRAPSPERSRWVLVGGVLLVGGLAVAALGLSRRAADAPAAVAPSTSAEAAPAPTAASASATIIVSPAVTPSPVPAPATAVAATVEPPPRTPAAASSRAVPAGPSARASSAPAAAPSPKRPTNDRPTIE